jgi:hypothetical protein
MPQRPTLEVVNGGSDNQTSPAPDRSGARNVLPLSNARTLAIGSGVDPSSLAGSTRGTAGPANEAIPANDGPGQRSVYPSVLLGEIFDHRPEPLWPVGAVLVSKLALAMDALRTEAAPGAGTLSRVAILEKGEVIIEGEYPGDERGIKLAGTWLYRFATGVFPNAEDIRPPSRLQQNLPAWLDEVCMRAIGADASAPYPSLRNFIDELEAQKLSVPDDEISKLVRAVSRYRYPSTEELAGDLGNALRIFTLPPAGVRSRRVTVLLIAGIVIAAVAAIVWRIVVRGV